MPLIKMIRLATLLSFAMIALGQVPKQAAYVRIETTAAGNLHGTLTVPIARVPVGLPEAFAQTMGCGASGLEKSPYESRISVQCPGTRPSALRFHAAVRLAELTPLLRQAGVGRLDLVLTAPQFRSLRLDPVIPPPGSRSGRYYQAQYSLDQIPQQITIDGGFEISQVQMLAACALGLILAPFLLLLPRPSDPLRLSVRTEGLFVLGWICWIWVLSRVGAGALLSYLFGHSAMGPVPALMAAPLVAVWIGSRLAGAQYARLIPNGPGADYYRHTLFWTGAAVTCIVSTMLGSMLSTSTNAFASNAFASILVGLVLAIACLTRLRRTARGGRHPLSEGDLHKRMFELAAKAGVNLRRISILTSPTPRPPAAFATRWGVIMLNEGLLRNLSRSEVDAIVCHELSHIGPLKRSTLVLPYLLIVASVLATVWVPNFVDFIPVLLLAVYFWFKAWRRAGERKADSDSVRWSGDPEAMITGLARVSHLQGMPFEWGAPVSWMMAHPSIMDRIRAIARAGGVSGSRIAELLEESRRDPADHYEEVPPAVVPDDAAFSPAMRKRLQMRLTWYMLLAPIVFGLPAVWLLERMELPSLAVVTVGILCSMLAMSVGLEWVMGSVRDRVKQRAIARHGQGVFAGISPAAEPRLFDDIYHYDLGMVRFVDETLEFAGDRARFKLDRRLTRRIWLGDGARHWTARQVVYIECQPSPEAEPVIFSLQSFEAWFWPSTVRMAKRLYGQVEAWHKASSASPEPPRPCALPQVEGRPPTFISFRTAYRLIGIYSGIAFLLATLGTWFFGSRGFWDPSAVLCAVAVCCALALFMLAPRMRWDRLKTLPDSQYRLPADS